MGRREARGPSSGARRGSVAGRAPYEDPLVLALKELEGAAEHSPPGVDLCSVVAHIRDFLDSELVFAIELAHQGGICLAAKGARGRSFDPGSLWSPAGDLKRALASEEPAVLDLGAGSPAPSPLTSEDEVVTVPLRLSDGSRYGMLCAISGDADRGGGDIAVRFMQLMAELAIPDLDRQRQNQLVRTALSELVEGERVDVAYQPVCDLRRHRCIGVEALARFPEPFTRPDRTFAVAQRFGFGLELEELVVRQAWPVLHRLGRDQFLALNLTPPTLLALARRARERTDVDLSSLVVEITEHEAIEAYANLRDELAVLRARGLRLAVDDAGAGYASMRHVLELAPDILKIDRYLIAGLSQDCTRRAAVRSFVALARDLGSTVIAEGVESAADLATVRDLGIDAAQGYFLARPSVAPADLTAWIGERPGVRFRAAAT